MGFRRLLLVANHNLDSNHILGLPHTRRPTAQYHTSNPLVGIQMDQQNATLVSFTPTSIPRPTFLQTLTKLSAKNIPSPSELRAIESQLLEYKTLHEQRLKHCDDQVAILDAQYNNAREKKHDKLGKIGSFEAFMNSICFLFCAYN